MPRVNRPQNKNHLKSDRDNTMARNPTVQQDQFGSRHNADDVKANQRQRGPSARGPGKPDLAYRESGQDTRTSRGKKNRAPGSRRAATKKRSSTAK